MPATNAIPTYSERLKDMASQSQEAGNEIYLEKTCDNVPDYSLDTRSAGNIQIQ